MQTRKQRADALLERVMNGPSVSFAGMTDAEEKGAREALRLYQVWQRTWVSPELIGLIPELRGR